MYQKVNYPEKPCVECGKTFKPKSVRGRFCGNKCMQRKKNREWSKNNPEKVKAKDLARDHAKIRRKYTYECKNCGTEYHPKAKLRNKFCSRECAFKYSKGKPAKLWGDYCEVVEAKYSAIVIKECVVCGRPHYRKPSSIAVCSNECSIQRIDKARIDALNVKRDSHECPDCGVLFCPIGGAKLCKHCSDKRALASKRRSKRIRRHKTRADMNGVKFDKFDPLTVLNRDEWICQGCGCDTPQALRGTTKDDAPELDHVIPLSKGGEHTMINTQCLCRVCNIIKTDKSMDEFVQWNQ